MPYRLTAKAADDVKAIYSEGLRLFGAAQAETYHRRLSNCFKLLVRYPAIGRRRFEMSPPVRVHPIGRHIVIYIDMAEEVLVVRVRHAREDWLPPER